MEHKYYKGAQFSLMYCSYAHFILFLRPWTIRGYVTGNAPKYIFRRNIGFNSPFLCAINLFTASSPQDGTSSNHCLVFSPHNNGGNKTASHQINPPIHPSIQQSILMSQSRFLHKEYSKKIRKAANKAAIDVAVADDEYGW